MKFRNVILAVGALALTACGDYDNESEYLTVDESEAVYVDIEAAEIEINGEKIKDRVHFGFDSFEISQSQVYIAQKMSAVLATTDDTSNIIIEGHCDARGTRDYNLALGKKRAEALKDLLVKNGVSETKITTLSYGKDRLIHPGDSTEAHAVNRRAVIIVESLSESDSE